MSDYQGSPFQQLYQKALSDDSFRQQLDTDAEGALRSLGIEPTDDLLDAIEDAIEAVKSAREALGEDERFFVS